MVKDGLDMVMTVETVTGERLAAALHDGSIRDMPAWMLLEASAEVARLVDVDEQLTRQAGEMGEMAADLQEKAAECEGLEKDLEALQEKVSDRDVLIENLKNGYDDSETVRLQNEMIELLKARVARLTAWLPAEKRRKLGLA